jgi:hypothetical protein
MALPRLFLVASSRVAWAAAVLTALCVGTGAQAQVVLTAREATGGVDIIGGAVLDSRPFAPAGVPLDAPFQVSESATRLGSDGGTLTSSGLIQVNAILGEGLVDLSVRARSQVTGVGRAQAYTSGSVRWDLDVLQDTTVDLAVVETNLSRVTTEGFAFVSFNRVLANGGLVPNTMVKPVRGLLLEAGHYAVFIHAYGVAFNSGSSLEDHLGRLTLTGNFTTAVAAVPEPATWALMGLGLVGIGMVSRRRSLV